MGQKVSPIGLRIGINKGWESNWYAKSKDFKVFLKNDIEIRKYLNKKLKNASVASVLISRKPGNTEVTIHTSKPGMVIGRSGEDVDKMKKELSKLTNEDIHISIMEVKNPDLNAQIVALSIAHQIENRLSYRAAQKKAIRNAMKLGAKGIKTQVSGRLNGADIARSEGYSEGTIPLHTLRSDVEYATAEADTTFGKLGVKVWIYKGEILPSKKEGGNTHVDTK